jgi:uncharacterized integral membrane protein
MISQARHTIGVFDDLEKAQQTIDELRQRGFPPDEIGIIGHIDDEGLPIPWPHGLRAAEQNVVRAVSMGGLFGAIIGALVALVIPGLAEVTQTGRWFELLGGAALGAAIGGCLLAFCALGFSWPHARLYKRDLEQGRFIVMVKNGERSEESLKVLRRQAVHSEED